MSATSGRQSTCTPRTHPSIMSLRFPTPAFALLLALALPAAAQSPGAARRGVTPEDYYSFNFVADPRLSPDGKLVVYVLSHVDRVKNRRVPSLWLVSADGTGSPRMLVDESYSPGAPRWSPDGRTIAVTATRAPGDTNGGRGPAAGAPATVGRPRAGRAGGGGMVEANLRLLR